MDQLENYLVNGVENIVMLALRASLSNPRESAFMASFAASAKKSASLRLKSEKNGVHIPPFLIASIASSCNLHCAGCYARGNSSCGDTESRGSLSAGQWGRIFSEAQDIGVSFILLAGGEPLTRRDVLERAAEVKKILVPVFTNGTMLKGEYIGLFDKNRNLLPVLSIEGGEERTDLRRGNGVYACLCSVMDSLLNHGIFYGASITVTTGNIGEITSNQFIAGLYKKGCRAVIFVEYVPIAPGSAGLAPSEYERKFMSERLDGLRAEFSQMLFISFPGDELASGGCLASGRGFFHISPGGQAEPCPFSPYSDTDVRDKTLIQALSSPLFKRLREGACLEGSHSGGCVLFEKEDEVKGIVGGMA